MAKDDYFVIVGKMLLYLYRRLKGKDTRDPMEHLKPNAKDYPIREEYFNYIVRHVYKDGLIEGVAVTVTPSGDPLEVYITERTQITPEGIDYLQSNSRIAKALGAVPDAIGVVGLFI